MKKKNIRATLLKYFVALAFLGAIAPAFAQTATPPATPPAAEPAKDEVVNMEEFKVSTTLGTYTETSSNTVGKVPLDLKDLASTIQVFNKNFINDKLANTVEDVYSYVVGMTRENTAATGFTLRGFDSNPQNTVLNNVQYDGQSGGASRFGSPTTAEVERIEVLKGPNSVLYGSMSPGGIINIVTKSPQATQASYVKLTGSTYDGQGTTLGEHAGFITTLDSTGPVDAEKKWLYRFVYSYEKLPTWRQFDWARNQYIFPSVTYRPDANSEYTLKIESDAQHRLSTNSSELAAPFNLIANVPTNHSLVYVDPDSQEYDRGTVYSFFATHHFLDKWVGKLSVRDVHHSDGRQLVETNALVNQTPAIDSTLTQRYRDQWNRRAYLYIDANAYADFGPENFKNTVLIGTGFGYESESFVRWLFANAVGPQLSVYYPVHSLLTRPIYDPTKGPTQEAVQKYYSYTGYVSDQIKIGSHWRASFGIRTEKLISFYHDWANLNGNFAVPGLHNNSDSTVPSTGLVYQPTDSISLYASYVKGYKPAAAQAVKAGSNLGFPPEKSTQTEVGIKSDFLHNTVSVLASVYWLKRNDVTQPIPGVIDANGFTVYENLSAESDGAELSVNYQPIPNWQMTLGYSYIHAWVTDSAGTAALAGATLAQAPRHQGNYWTRYNFAQGPLVGFGVGMGLLYTGERYGTSTIVDANKMKIPSNFRTDLAFYYKRKHTQFALSINNVFDLSYIASADTNVDVRPGDPRKLTASVQYNF